MPPSRLRLVSTSVENLSPGRFILLVGLIGAVLRAYPGSYLEQGGPRTVLALAAVADAAAVLLWWIAVRHRRFSLWKTALHVMLALDLADALGFLLMMAMLSLDERGHLMNTIAHEPLLTFLGALVPPYIVLSAIRFVGAVLLVAIGRRLPGSGESVIPAARHTGVSASV